MLDVHVRLRQNPDGSAVAELIDRDGLLAAMQQGIAGGTHEDKGPPVKPYDPNEPRVMKHTRISGDPVTERAENVASMQG